MCGTVSKTVTVIAGFDDVAMVGEAVEQRGGHLRVVEDPGPFTEGKVGGEDHAGALVEFAQQVEQSVVAWIEAAMEFALSQAVWSGDAFEHRPSECSHCV